MNSNIKIGLFVAIFSSCLIAYLILPVLLSLFGETQIRLGIFDNSAGDFVFFLTFAMFAAFTLTSIVNACYGLIMKRRYHRPKIGEILMSLDLITREDLQKALSQQKLRLGEILVRAGRITSQQRDLALELQNRENRKIGQILKGQGQISEEDLRWALNKRNKKMGKILRNMNLIADYDVKYALEMGKRIRMDKKGNIVDIQ